MKTNVCRRLMFAVCFAAGVAAYGQDATGHVNPFLSEFKTPYGVPPFEQITIADYREGFLKGMEEQKKEIDAIVNQRSMPDFENTIVALDRSGAMLQRVASVFFGQSGCNTNAEMQALEQEMAPLLSAHSDDISLNERLFQRVKEVYDNRAKFNLDKEQTKLLENTYKDFVRSGANLSDADQQKLRALNEKISMLQITFEQNMLKETNAFKLVITDKKDLSGLPASLIAQAAETAKSMGEEGKWVFTLHNPSIMPFLL